MCVGFWNCGTLSETRLCTQLGGKFGNSLSVCKISFRSSTLLPNYRPRFFISETLHTFDHCYWMCGMLLACVFSSLFNMGVLVVWWCSWSCMETQNYILFLPFLGCFHFPKKGKERKLFNLQRTKAKLSDECSLDVYKLRFRASVHMQCIKPVSDWQLVLNTLLTSAFFSCSAVVAFSLCLDSVAFHPILDVFPLCPGYACWANLIPPQFLLDDTDMTYSSFCWSMNFAFWVKCHFQCFYWLLFLVSLFQRKAWTVTNTLVVSEEQPGAFSLFGFST